MEDRQTSNRIGKIICAALLALTLGTGITVASPVSNGAANMANLLMEDSSLGGSPGRNDLGIATPVPESCNADADSGEPQEETVELEGVDARLLPN